MKYRTKSANVLNEADRFERILDWQLFQYEQSAVLYNAEVGQWVPGKPLFLDPRTDPRNSWTHRWLNADAGGHGNCVRPMYEVLDDDSGAQWHNDLLDVQFCETCDVGSYDAVDVFWCWNCGVYEKPIGPKYRSPLVFNPDYDPYTQMFGVKGMKWGELRSGWMTTDATHRASYNIDEMVGALQAQVYAHLFSPNEVRGLLGIEYQQPAPDVRASIRGHHYHYNIVDELAAYSMADVEFTRSMTLRPISSRVVPRVPPVDPYRPVEPEITLPTISESAAQILDDAPYRGVLMPNWVYYSDLRERARNQPIPEHYIPPVPEPREFPTWAETDRIRHNLPLTQQRRSRT